MRYLYAAFALLTLTCAYIIAYVGLGYGWSIGQHCNNVRVNTVLLNLSYSYMAGLIFFLFTTTIPYYIKKHKYQPFIKEKLSIIHGRLCESAKAAYSVDDKVVDIKYDRESLKAQFGGHPINDPSYVLIYTLYQYLRHQRNDILDCINGLLVYADFLKPDDLRIIEEVKESKYFSQINVFQWNDLDVPEEREKLGEYLAEIIVLTKKYKVRNGTV